MKALQMVDLKQQYLRIKDEVDAAVSDVIQSSLFIGGPQVNKFASALSEYLKIKHVIPCANGTDALQIAMMGLGLEPGDEVITPSFTYVATTEVIALLRLKPVFVEVDPSTFCIDAQAIKDAYHYTKDKSNCSCSPLWPCRQYGRYHGNCPGAQPVCD